jgi:hypothetical protein
MRRVFFLTSTSDASGTSTFATAVTAFTRPPSNSARGGLSAIMGGKQALYQREQGLTFKQKMKI